MITYIKGDLFSSESLILAHACNCRGSWGAGVARIFRSKFPSAYTAYQKHCASKSPIELLGTTFLAPTTDGRYIACLFTSDRTGAYKLPPNDIVHYTDLAMHDLYNQLHQLAETSSLKTEISMPKINSGLFAVPWNQTENVLAKYPMDITIYTID